MADPSGPAPAAQHAARGDALATELRAGALDARRRTLETVADLDDEQMLGPQLAIVNPPLWEIGHVGWFQEFWNLRYRPEGPPHGPSLIERADELYNSAAIGHDERWSAPLIARRATLDYLAAVQEAVLEKLDREGPGEQLAYFLRLATFHEDMHGEAFLWTRQTHGLPVPALTLEDPAAAAGPTGPHPGDVELPGGELMLGASGAEEFVFDNEKWAHRVVVEPFRIARAPVTNREFLAFVEDGGYARRELWSDGGWSWRSHAAAEHPVYWSPSDDGWRRRRFDSLEPLPPHQPVAHVCWWEAEAFCAWAGRRLPREAEWELAATAEPVRAGGGVAERKRRFPWGDEPPGPEHANLDAGVGGPVDVAAFPAGDGAFGLRQLIGNVWEHCADDFAPYPGFVRDPYREYSEPWFGGGYRTSRGGAWPTRGRMLRATWRNFSEPHRRDQFLGFRTCRP